MAPRRATLCPNGDSDVNFRHCPWRTEPSTAGAAHGRKAALAAILLVAAGAARAADWPAIAVVRVVDGDTVVVERGGVEERIRLLGVDAPERGREGRPGEPYSRVATAFVVDRLRRAERVELQVAGDRIDAHGRTLGFLWLRLPGRLVPANLSEELLEAGLARAIRGFEYPGKARFLDLEAGARRAGKGIWRGSRERGPPGP